MPRQKHIGGVGQREAIALGGVRRDRRRVLEAGAIAAAEDVRADGKFITAQLGLARVLRRIRIDQLGQRLLFDSVIA